MLVSRFGEDSTLANIMASHVFGSLKGTDVVGGVDYMLRFAAWYRPQTAVGFPKWGRHRG
ncbi:MAG: hypothetical protein CM15mP128_4220 [Methanobacteriota archaeon]|nr:MAG: hypothetical protein CM15mP128_4220 [Euryarchaeota archaeon]